MDQQDLRLQCLKMASELGGNTEAVISAAQRMLDFIAGTPQPLVHDSKATELVIAPAATASASEPPAATSAEPLPATEVADPIAACGTALVLPEGRDLIDAVPNPEVGAPIAEAIEVAVSDSPSSIVAPATETKVQEEVVAAAEATKRLPESQADASPTSEADEPSGEEAEQVAEAAVDKPTKPARSEQAAQQAEPAVEAEAAAETAKPATEEPEMPAVSGRAPDAESSEMVSHA